MLIYHQDFRKPTRLKALTNKCRQHRKYTSDMFYIVLLGISNRKGKNNWLKAWCIALWRSVRLIPSSQLAWCWWLSATSIESGARNSCVILYEHLKYCVIWLMSNTRIIHWLLITSCLISRDKNRMSHSTNARSIYSQRSPIYQLVLFLLAFLLASLGAPIYLRGSSHWGPPLQAPGSPTCRSGTPTNRQLLYLHRLLPRTDIAIYRKVLSWFGGGSNPGPSHHIYFSVMVP